MRRPLPVPVEPLSPQRWAKVERALFNRWEAESALMLAPYSSEGLARSRLGQGAPPAWLTRAYIAAALVLAVCVTFAAVHQGAGVAPEPHTSRISTGREGSHLALDGLALDVQPESTVVVGETPRGGLLVVLDRGRISCDVKPRSADSPLIVQAGAAQVRVVGTRFTVERSGEAARVAVEHGVVEVAMGGHVAIVNAGQVWPPPKQTR